MTHPISTCPSATILLSLCDVPEYSRCRRGSAGGWDAASGKLFHLWSKEGSSLVSGPEDVVLKESFWDILATEQDSLKFFIAYTHEFFLPVRAGV